MAMSKKDFESIARGIKAARVRNKNNSQGRRMHNLALDCAADYIAMNLEIDHPRFDKERFLAATKAENKS